MSRRPIALSADLKRLRDDGYDVDIRGAYLLVKDVPYVNAQREVKYGTLVAELTLAGDVTAPPATHVSHFTGDYPCNRDGTPIAQIKNASDRKDLGDGIIIDHTFSAKPDSGQYADYHEKVTTYVALLSNPARALDPTVTAQTYPVIEATDDDNSPFAYLDTASSRADIGVATRKLAVSKIAIAGLGGTGSYVLDLVAKTPVGQIHIYDADVFLQHNAFRAPGAPSLEDLRAKRPKVIHLRDIYAHMHRGIVAHPVRVEGEVIDELLTMDFVFLCLDPGPAKRQIVTRLEAAGVPFVDTGMGLELVEGSLTGMLRVTTSTSEKHDHVSARVPLADDDAPNDYDKNIQVADLNAASAALAVMKWKKTVGFYRDVRHEHHCVLTVDGNMLSNSDEA